jgi:hypothetical protein|tara:strand:+ start:2815 stop:3102 length:288 start_codon:yes stop_codon:yes gene_type:complete
MTDAQEDHLRGIVEMVSEQIHRKYRAGQQEHGGNLWERTPLTGDLIDEAIDQATYALTLAQQLTWAKRLLEQARGLMFEEPLEARRLIDQAMGYL